MLDDIKQDENREEKLTELRQLFSFASDVRAPWEGHWQECYDYTLPQRLSFSGAFSRGGHRTSQIFDATAMNAVDQLSASLLSELTPAWSSWFSLVPGSDLTDQEREDLSPALEQATRIMQDHFDRSNFIVEMHQAFMDLVTAGTGSLLVEEALVGDFSAFQFSAIPLSQLYVLEGEDGRLSITYRKVDLTSAQLKKRFGDLENYSIFEREEELAQAQQKKYSVIEAVIPHENHYKYYAFLENDEDSVVLEEGGFDQSPFITFRWTKSPGEIYGRSPVMKSLPDIKTANKVVELILKNASIAVTGIWQADDDGVLNPANIKLVPGTIIPKAVGSAGLKPLEMPGNFDVSQLVLEDLRTRIKNALLVDKLAALDGRNMTATEVLERSGEVTRILGATYGRLQSELLMPLLKRCYSILRRRGEIPDLDLDGRIVGVRYTSPIAQAQNSRDVQRLLSWVAQALSINGGLSTMIDSEQVMKYAADKLGIPEHFIQSSPIEKTQITEDEYV